MQNHAPIPVYRVSDQAVDGLLRGLAAGVAMILFLALATALAGRDVVEMLASLAATESARPFNGVLSHLAVSAVFGIVWGVAAPLLLRRTTLPLRLWGMLYALPLTPLPNRRFCRARPLCRSRQSSSSLATLPMASRWACCKVMPGRTWFEA